MKKLFRSLTALLVCLSLVLPIHALTVEQAKDLLEIHYIDDLPSAAYEAQTLDELMAALDDPYTVYLSAEQYQQFLGSIHDEKAIGIGVSIREDPRGMFIASVLDNTPAAQAGLKAGDIILSANGVKLTSTQVASAQLSGEEGTSVTIRVLKQDGSEVELELIRRPFAVATTVRFGTTENGKAGYIVCTSFGNETPDHFSQAILTHNDQVNTWIIDLSANPGGTSNSGMESAGRFIGSGVMYYLRDGQNQYRYGFTTSACPKITDHPAIVLLSADSASSAELFTAAIRDHKVGISIGQRSFGKGIAQVVFDETSHPDLFDADALKVTSYRFFSPDGATNDGMGILPTLLLSPEHTYSAALLLSTAKPHSAVGHLRLKLADQTFYVELSEALSPQLRSAFVELLEALPPTADLWEDNTTDWWTPTTPAEVAQRHGLTEFVPRTFRDLEGSLHSDAVNTLAAYGLVGGYGDGTFHPTATITRAEFCAMLVNILALDLPPVSSSRFYDVGTSDWYAPAVHSMAEKGFLSGYSDGSFRPNAPLSQEEMVSILARVAPHLNMYAHYYDLVGPAEGALDGFSTYSDWARRSAWLLSTFTMDLSGLSPQDTTSRALAADLICQMLTAGRILWN